MSFSWWDYLELARELAGKGTAQVSTEARRRSAISRAYYSAYHDVRDYITSRYKWKPNSGSVHAQVINFLLWNSDRRLKSIGGNLSRLLDMRKQADYDDQMEDVPGQLAVEALALAEKVLVELTALRLETNTK